MRNDYDSMGLETLALLAFLSTLPIYSPNVVPLQQCINNPDVMEALINPMMATCIATSMALFLISLLHIRIASRRAVLAGRIGCIAYLAGMALLLGMTSCALPPNTAFSFVAGILLGPGISIMASVWGARFFSFNLRQALLFVCVACASVAAIDWIYSFLPRIPLAIIMAALSLTGGIYPILNPRQNDVSHEQADSRSESTDDLPRFTQESSLDSYWQKANASTLVSRLGVLRRFTSVMFPALIGLSMFAFFMGVSRVTILGSINAEIIGNVISCAALAPLCFARSRHPFVVTLYQVAIPSIACVMLCGTILAYDFGIVEAFIPIASYSFFCGIAQISLALGIASMKGREFSPSMTWSLYLLLFTVFSAMGLFFGSAKAYEESEFVSSSLFAAYCAFLILNSIACFLHDSRPSTNESVSINNEESCFEKRCDALAERFSLSPREREIIEFLGRGHTSAFIAKSLIISESTVYTHTRNIYRKIGIGSKEELIQALSTPSDENAPL